MGVLRRKPNQGTTRRKVTAGVAALSTLAFTALAALPAEADPGTYSPGSSPTWSCAGGPCTDAYPTGDDLAATTPGASVGVDVLANDCHSTLAGNDLTFQLGSVLDEADFDALAAVSQGDELITVPDNDPRIAGTVSVTGKQLVFTPSAGFTGTARFDYIWTENGPEVTEWGDVGGPPVQDFTRYSYGNPDAPEGGGNRYPAIVTVGVNDSATLPPTGGAASDPYPATGLSASEAAGGSNPSEVCDCLHGTDGDPVDTATGSFSQTFTDLHTPGRGPALAVTRTYDSTSAGHDGPFGYGWYWSYGMRLSVDSSTGAVTVHQENGSTVAFDAGSSAGSFTPVQPRILASLSEDPTTQVYTFTRRNRETFTFNSIGQLTSISDLNGNTTTLGYDSTGQLSLLTDPAGRSYTVNTNSDGHITSIKDQAGRTVTYGYSTAGDLTSVTDPSGATWTYGYDGGHELQTLLDPDQQSLPAAQQQPLTNVYDGQGRVTSQTDFAGRTTAFDYTSIPNATAVTSPVGNVSVDYYSNGLRTKSTKGYGTAAAASTEYDYDPTTEALTSVTDPNGNVTAYSYDDAGDLLTVTDPKNNETVNTYDSLGDLLTTTDPAGVTTTNTYDNSGNLTSTAAPLLDSSGTTTATRTVSYHYDDPDNPGLPTKITDPDGNDTINAYDPYGDLISTTTPATSDNPDGATTTYSYDTTTAELTSMVSARGNAAGADPANYTTTYSYDPDGRLLQTQDPLWSSGHPNLHQTVNTYDPDGNLLTATDGNNNTTSYGYNADGQLVQTTRADGSIIKQTYTADGLLHTHTDANNNRTIDGYDSRGDLTSSTDPLGNVTNYSYDLDGNLTLVAQPGATCTGNNPTRGCRQLSYNADNQLTDVTYLDGGAAGASGVKYDPDGRRTSETDASGTSTWTYDSLGRVTQTTDGNANTVAYGYDLDGNTTSITYPDGRTATRGFNADDELNSVNDGGSGGGNTARLGYDPDGNTTSITYPTGSPGGPGVDTDSFTFDHADQLGEVADTESTSSAPATLADFGYTRDGANQLTGSTVAGSAGITEPDQTYTYNSLNQLTGNTVSGGSDGPTSYSYDAGDNLTGYGQNSTTSQTQTFNADDQLCWTTTKSVSNPTCATAPATATSYTYDNAGNRTTASTPTSGSVTVDAKYTANSTGAASLSTPSFSTTSNDTLLVALVSADGPGGGVNQNETVTGAGLTWTLESRAAGQTGTAEVWAATPTGALSNQTVTATESQTGTYRQTITLMVLTGAAGVGAIKHASGATGAPTLSLTSTAAGGLVFAAGQDGTSATTRTLASGQTLLHEFSMTASNRDGWSQRTTSRVATAGQSVTMADTAPTTDKWDLAAAEVVPTNTPPAVTNYSWDQANNLNSYTPPSGGSAADQYTYNADGLRTAETGNTTATYTWDTRGSTPLLLSDGTNDYLYGTGNQPLEQIGIGSGTISWLHHDQLGNTRLVTNMAGDTIATYSYTPYGEVTSHTGTATTPLQYGDGYTDGDTGLIYFQHRYYDPGTAQFLSRDPLATTTWQPYNYTGDTPLNANDPLGLGCWPSWACGVEHAVGSGLSAAGDAAKTAARGVVDVTAVVPYALYYGSYYAAKETVAGGCAIHACWAGHIAALGWAPSEGVGLGADIVLDELKDVTGIAHESWADESNGLDDPRPINPLHSFGALPGWLRGGPSVYLPGVSTRGQCIHVDFEW